MYIYICLCVELCWLNFMWDWLACSIGYIDMAKTTSDTHEADLKLDRRSMCTAWCSRCMVNRADASKVFVLCRALQSPKKEIWITALEVQKNSTGPGVGKLEEFDQVGHVHTMARLGVRYFFWVLTKQQSKVLCKLPMSIFQSWVSMRLSIHM